MIMAVKEEISVEIPTYEFEKAVIDNIAAPCSQAKGDSNCCQSRGRIKKVESHLTYRRFIDDRLFHALVSPIEIRLVFNKELFLDIRDDRIPLDANKELVIISAPSLRPDLTEVFLAYE